MARAHPGYACVWAQHCGEKARLHVGEKISAKGQLQLTPGCTMNAESSSGSGFEEVLW